MADSNTLGTQGNGLGSKTTIVLFIALQGVDYVADGTNAHGVTGAVTTVEAVIG